MAAKLHSSISGEGGDLMADDHELELFIGNWAAFAECSCGWFTPRLKRYYSPIFSFSEVKKLQDDYTEAFNAHIREVNRPKWRVKRFWRDLKKAFREAAEEITEKYNLEKL